VKVIFMGNPAIANPVLHVVHDSRHDLLGVVSNGPKEIGRGRSFQHTAVGKLAHELGLNFIPVHSLKDESFRAKLKSYNPDIFVVVAFRILPKSLLEIPRMGAVNLHTSLLPKYRGAAPIQHALLNGDNETGITTFLIEAEIDTGAILLQKKISISPKDNFGTLSEKIADAGANLVLKTLDQLDEGLIQPTPQNDKLATGAPKITQEMCKIDWSESAEKNHNKVRAFSPSPGAYTLLKGKRVKIFNTSLSFERAGTTGSISLLDKNRMAVNCGAGQLELLEVQLEGKRRMTMAECLRGMHIVTGDSIGE